MNEPGLHVEPDPELLELLKRQLDKDERLVWSGMPAANAFVRPYRSFQLFGLGFVAFATLWTAMAVAGTYFGKNAHASFDFFPCFGLIFVAAGIGMTVGTEWAMRRRAKGTIYGISSKKAIVIEGPCTGNMPEIFQYSAGQLTKISRKEAKDGSGDLIFDMVDSGVAWGKGRSARPVMRARGFVGIQNVHEVERLLRSTLQVP